MRRCVLCGRWVLLAFQEEGGLWFVSEAARLGLGGVWANEAALCNSREPIDARAGS